MEEKPSTRRRVTLQDVAKDAGVSRATASLVLRESPLVADETRALVLASMRKLGYVYNRAAASLRARRSHAVGLAVTDITNPFFAELAVGIETLLDDANYAVLLSNTSERLGKQERLLEVMHEFQVDGVLFCPVDGTPVDVIERLQRWQLPVVLIARYLPGVEVDYVGGDNVRGAELAVDHLVGRGHTNLGFLGGPAHASARADRLRGFRNALDRHNLEPPAEPVTSPTTRDGGYQAMETLLDGTPSISAVLCYNDVVALGAMLALQARGIEPGADVAVVGFDDIAEAALWHPGLSTVSIPPRRIGEEAVRLLLQRIEQPELEARRVIVPPDLIVRASSSPLCTSGV